MGELKTELRGCPPKPEMKVSRNFYFVGSETYSLASGEHLGLVLMGQNRRAQNRPWRPNSEVVLKWRTAQNFYLFDLRHL